MSARRSLFKSGKLQSTLAFVFASLWLCLGGCGAAGAQPSAPGPASANTQTASSANGDVVSPFKTESVRFKLEPGWFEANRSVQQGLILRQFLPPGDNAKSIHKMINFCAYLGRQQSARDFMADSKKTMEKLAGKATIDWHLISDDTPGDVMFEYSVKDMVGNPDQYEIQRVIQGHDALYDIIYHYARPQVTPTERQNTINWLKTARVEKIAK